MATIKKAKRFLFIVWFSLFGFIILYTYCYHLLGNRNITVSHSYKQFLIQHTKGKRFIIDSGSNSYYGINARMLEDELGILTINLADHAGYPLKNKLLRIEQYFHSGDIVLLPLEWGHYTNEDVPGIFLENILGDLHHYYFHESLIEEIKQIWKLPLSSFIKGIKRHIKFIKKSDIYLKEHIRMFNNGGRGTFIKYAEVFSLDKGLKDRTCDQYVLQKGLEQGANLSETFKQNVKIIKRLQRKGIKFFFAWPVVVGDNCYSKKNREKIDRLTNIIKDYLQENGLDIIGNPYENKFLGKDMFDTYYHLKQEARDVHTKKLIEDITQSANFNWFKQNTAVSPSLDISL